MSVSRRIRERRGAAVGGDERELGLLPLPGWAWTALILIPMVVAAIVPATNADLGAPAWTGLHTALPVGGALVAVLLRRARPRTAAALALACAIIGIAVGGPVLPLTVAVLACVFSVGNLTDRWTTLAVAAGAAVIFGSVSLIWFDAPWGEVRSLVQIVAFLGFAAAAGDGNRSRRAFIAAMSERALRAEQTKEAEARRRVADERIRIARDLHDVLAHQIAVINLHAGVASGALHTRPDDAERSLATIRKSARSVLTEIGGLLSVLRASEEEPDVSNRGPLPGLADLDEMINRFRANGLAVEYRQVGEAGVLDESADVTAYRLVQEALTNAHKHGLDGSALLHLEYGPADLEITVTNVVAVGRRNGRSGSDGDPTSPQSLSGHGLIGARERVAAVGGALEAGLGPGPVYRFVARVPNRPANGGRSSQSHRSVRQEAS